MSKNYPRRWFLLAVLLVLVSPAARSASEAIIEEIIVVAQKREQSLQKVPISMVALTAEKIAQQGFASMHEAADFVPNLYMDEDSSASIIVSRGIVTNGLNAAFEQSTPMFIDNVYMGKSRQSRAPLLDVERVEILRGPQPTYFGLNAIAGAINVISKVPTAQSQGYIRGSYGNENEASLEAAYGGPVARTVGFRLAGRYYAHDGFIENTAPGGDDLPELETYAGRITLDWAPSERLILTLRSELYDNAMNGQNYQLIGCDPAVPVTPCGNVLAGGSTYGLELVADDRQNNGGLPFSGAVLAPTLLPFQDVSAYPLLADDGKDTNGTTVALEVSYDFVFAALTSVTAYQRFFSEINFDLDSTAAAVISALQEDEQDQWSQEIRLASPDGETLEWMVGFYYQKNDFDTFFEWISGYGGNDVLPWIVTPLGANRFIGYSEEAQWLSVFGSATWHVNDQFSVDLGLRYTDVDKQGGQFGWTRSINPDGNPATPDFGSIIAGSEGSIDASFNDDSVDPAVTVNWQATDETRVYVKWARGFKTGGLFANVNVANNPAELRFDSEQAETREIGIKSSLFGRRLQANLAFFDVDYDGLQVTAFAASATTFLISNAAGASSKGFELDGQWAVSERLTFNFGASYLDAAYDSFSAAACSNAEEQANRAAGQDAVSAGICDRSGEELLYAIPWTFMGGLDYSVPLTETLNLAFQIDAVSYDEHEVSDVYIPGSKQDRYEKINLRVALRASDGKWEVAAYGRNITDSEIDIAIGNGLTNGPADRNLIRGRGASYGVQFSHAL